MALALAIMPCKIGSNDSSMKIPINYSLSNGRLLKDYARTIFFLMISGVKVTQTLTEDPRE